MRTMDTNDWMLLNSIIYKIYTMNNIYDQIVELKREIAVLPESGIAENNKS